MRFAYNTVSERLTKVSDSTVSESESADWDIPQSYFYYNGGIETDWALYDWQERDNPCHPSYYMDSDRAASCNVLASDLGMIVKKNSVNKLWITTNNIKDTKPVSKAKLTVYNFQLQPVGTGETDNEGFAEIIPKGVPFIVAAESGEQKAYVRIADGEEQPVSRFDVGGKEIQKGLKGYVYGEEASGDREIPCTSPLFWKTGKRGFPTSTPSHSNYTIQEDNSIQNPSPQKGQMDSIHSIYLRKRKTLPAFGTLTSKSEARLFIKASG